MSPSATAASVKEINQELEEYARKYEAIQRHRRSANSPLTAAASDRQRLWSRQDSAESSRGGRHGGCVVEAMTGEREDKGRSTAVATSMMTAMNGGSNGELVSGLNFNE